MKSQVEKYVYDWLGLSETNTEDDLYDCIDGLCGYDLRTLILDILREVR